ncbi:hypothetical protein AYI69_g7451, partial [Smittium culicis]
MSPFFGIGTTTLGSICFGTFSESHIPFIILEITFANGEVGSFSFCTSFQTSLGIQSDPGDLLFGVVFSASHISAHESGASHSGNTAGIVPMFSHLSADLLFPVLYLASSSKCVAQTSALVSVS